MWAPLPPPHPARAARFCAAAIRERPAERVDPHDRDVADTVMLDAHAAEQVERGLAVRPRFHLPRADAGTHAHVRTGPLHALRRIEPRVLIGNLARELVPALQQLVPGAAAQPDARVLGHR